MKALERGERPPRPEDIRHKWYDDIWELMEECWHAEPEKRPTASEVVEQLPNIHLY